VGEDPTPSSEIPMVMPDQPMTFEEAEIVIKEDHEYQAALIDNVHPWWATLRWPMFILSCSFLVLCLSVIFLALTLKTATERGNKEYKEDACYDQLNINATEASARVRAAGTHIDASGWVALLEQVSGNEVTQETIDNVILLVEEVEKALSFEQEAIDERQTWIDDGRPLPCPV